MAFCNKPIRLMQNLGRTNRTSPATSKPSNKIGSTLGLRWWFWLSDSLPSTTLSSLPLPNSLDRNKTNAMASAAMMMKRNMICLHYGKLAVRASHNIFNSGQNFNHVVLVVAGGGKKPASTLGNMSWSDNFFNQGLAYYNRNSAHSLIVNHQQTNEFDLLSLLTA